MALTNRGIILAGDITSVIGTYITKAATTFKYKAQMRGMMRNIPMPKGKGSGINLPRAGTLTAYAVNRGDEISQYQKIAFTNTAIAPFTVAVHAVVDEFADWVAQEDMQSIIGEESGDAFVQYEEADLLTLLDGFSVSLGGGSTPRVSFIDAASARLAAGNTGSQPFLGPYYAMIHPYHRHAMAQDLGGIDSANGSLMSTTSGRHHPGDGDVRDEVLRRGFVKNLFGTEIHESGLLSTTGDVAKGGVWHRDALVYVPFKPMKTESWWEPKLQAHEVLTVAVYGRGEWIDLAGIELNMSAAVPTV